MKERLATVVYSIFTIIGTVILMISVWGLFSEGIVPAIIGILVASFSYGVGWSIRYIITGNKDSFIIDLILDGWPKKKLTLFAIANLPIYDFINQTKPLSFAEENSNLSDNENLNSLIYSGILAFQFFIYLELIKARFGDEPSKMAKEHMCLTLDRFGQETDPKSYLGQDIKKYIEIISKIYAADPTVVQIDNKEITLPKEYNAAMALLCYIEYSPYYSKDKENLHSISDDLDVKFADLLEQARSGIVERYSSIFLNKNIQLDKSSSLGVRIEDKMAA
ncbi:MAG: hypothetical protein KA100_01125 [Rickettsiales bacterium]|nr:hypothetical protein [Rickettsiales bacterium]